MYYSQHTPGYKAIKLGACTDSLWQSACFLTSFCNWLKEMGIMDVSPEWMNQYFIEHKLWSNGCNINMAKIAAHFDLSYEKVFSQPKGLCIAETNYYQKVAPQHFFLFRDGMRVDPLDYPADWEKNNYPLVSFRVLKKLKPENPTTPIPEVKPQDTAPVSVETPAPVEPVVVTGTAETNQTPQPTQPSFWDLVERVIQWFKKLKG